MVKRLNARQMLPSRSGIFAEAINTKILTKNHPDSPNFHPDSSHSHHDFPRSHNFPYSVLRFPIPAFAAS